LAEMSLQMIKSQSSPALSAIRSIDGDSLASFDLDSDPLPEPEPEDPKHKPGIYVVTHEAAATDYLEHLSDQ
jgi:hypothetical protein